MSIETKKNIIEAIKQFKDNRLFKNGLNLFKSLGYNTERRSQLNKNNYEGFVKEFGIDKSKLNQKKLLNNCWISVEFLFQLTQAEMSKQSILFDSGNYDDTIIEAYLFLAIQLKEGHYSRTQLSEITREVNRHFSMPVMILLCQSMRETILITQNSTLPYQENGTCM